MENVSKANVVAHTYNPSTHWEEAEGTHEFEANLIYLQSPKLHRTRGHCLQKQQQNKELEKDSQQPATPVPGALTPMASVHNSTYMYMHTATHTHIQT